MSRRERTEIIHDILVTIREKGRALPTHILYKSNLSSKMLNEYLQELLEKGFVAQHEERKKTYYVLEERGYKFLQDYQVIRRLLESYGLG